MHRSHLALVALCLTATLTACDRFGSDGHTHGPDGHTHTPSVESTPAPAPTDPDHAEVSIGAVMIGDMKVELAQSHGLIAAGKESHLVIRLPDSANGQTIVRAWIGTEDRTISLVGRADHRRDTNAYDVHAIAPDPLPADAKWWIEIQKPDGTRVVGSAAPLAR